MAAATKEKEEVLSVDDQFLKDYIARGGKAQEIDSGKEVDQGNVDDLLREVGTRQTRQNTDDASDKKLNEALSRGEKAAIREKAQVKKLQERAEKLKAADEERLAREKAAADQKAADAAEKQRQAEEAKRLTQQQKLRKAAGDAAHNLGESVTPAIDKISSLHTIGGIGLLVVVLIVLLFVVVQVNAQGDTRLKQFWAMLNGNAHLEGRVVPTGVNGGLTNPSASSTGASGNFGPGASTGTTPLNPATNGASGNFGSGVPVNPAFNGSYRAFTGSF